MSTKKQSLLAVLIEIYEKQLKKYDAKGFGPLFKEATEKLFECINQEIVDYWRQPSIKSFTFEDIEYTDGYFIFAYGENSVVHFHIKELPGWLFGIWWHEPTSDKTSDGDNFLKLSGTLFTQYEKNIDKFKPSRSELQCEIKINYLPNGKFAIDTWSIIDLLLFMYKEPALAFCRDYCGWDYNQEYHSRAEAERKLKHYLIWQENKDTYNKICDDRMIAKVRELFADELKNGTAILNDAGANWSPRYEIFLKKDAFEGFKDMKPGLYGFSDILHKQYIKIFTKEEKECKKISNKYKFYWMNPVSNCVYLADTQVFNKLKRQNKE